jgi:AcrR family transcriptional regulator
MFWFRRALFPTPRRSASRCADYDHAVDVLARQPVQTRSLASADRALAAALQTIEAEGWSGFKLAVVAGHGGMSIGLLSSRFGGKEQLFLAAQSAGLARLAATCDEVFVAEASAAAAITRAVTALAETLQREGRLLVGLTTGLPPGGPIADQGRACAHYLSRRFGELILEHRSELTHDDAEIAVDVCFRAVFASLERRVMYGPTFEPDHVIDWTTLLAEEASACRGYLLGPPRGAAPTVARVHVAAPPAPDRLEDQRSRLLDAGVALLSETPALDPAIQKVAKRAGVAVGTVYNYFPSKEALFVALIDHAQSALDAEFESMFARADWNTDDPDALVAAAVETIAANAQAHAEFLSTIVPRALTDRRVSDRGAQTVRLLGERFRSLLLTRRDAIRHAHPEEAVDVCFRLVFSAVVKRVAMGDAFETPRSVGADRLALELGDLGRAYLLG